MHFQDKGVYGRIVHLQPVTWKDSWPVVGINDNDHCGEPALSGKKPNVGKTYPVQTPQESDEFDSDKLGLQWQWHANPGQAWVFPSKNGYLRMYGQNYPDDYVNMWDISNMLLQKFPSLEFTATVKLQAVLRNEGDRVGLIVMGMDYVYIALVKISGGYSLEYKTCNDAERKTVEQTVSLTELREIKIIEF
jgi:beta-xylosidase